MSWSADFQFQIFYLKFGTKENASEQKLFDSEWELTRVHQTASGL